MGGRLTRTGEGTLPAILRQQCMYDAEEEVEILFGFCNSLDNA